MLPDVQAAPAAYLDIAGLARLRADAGEAQGAREAARQFEALFAHQLIKSMRDATIEGGLFDSRQAEFYRALFDQQLSLEVTRDAGLGLAAVLERQLDSDRGAPPASGALDPAAVLRHAKVSRQAADNLDSNGTYDGPPESAGFTRAGSR